MEIPPGFGMTNRANKVYQLKKALYGLNQLPSYIVWKIHKYNGMVEI